MSYEYDKVVKQVMDTIKRNFGGLEASIGKEHTYLGMNLTLNDNQTVRIEMSGYIKEVMQAFCRFSPVKSSAITPAKSNLFNVDTLSKRLPSDKAKMLHHCVAKLL